jgi:hypothetical protein
MTDSKHEEKERPLPASTERRTDDDGEGEFRLIIRKLEVPVRPRGVLAE